MFYSRSTGGFFTREIHGTNIPADAVEITQSEYVALMSGQAIGRMIISDSGGRPLLAPACPGPEYVWTGTEWALDAERQKKRIIDLMQYHMDAKARAYGYDNILSAKSYVSSTSIKWRTEGEAFRDWQDAVWSFGLALLAEYEAGTNTITTEEALLAALPPFPLDS